MRKKLLAMMMVGLISAFTLTGCGGDESTDSGTTSQKTEQQSEDTSEAGEISEETSEETSEEADTSDTSEVDSSAYAEYLNSCYMGISDEDDSTGIYMCFSKDGERGMLVVYSRDDNEYLCVAGTVAEEEQSDGSSAVTIEDAENELSFTFTEQYMEDDDYYQLDLGEDLGTAKVAACEPSEVLEVLEAIDKKGAKDILSEE